LAKMSVRCFVLTKFVTHVGKTTKRAMPIRKEKKKVTPWHRRPVLSVLLLLPGFLRRNKQCPYSHSQCIYKHYRTSYKRLIRNLYLFKKVFNSSL
jgi:hypothetical protein